MAADEATIFYDVEQPSLKWRETRRTIGGTGGKYFGYNPYVSARRAYILAVTEATEEFGDYARRAMDHGVRYEPKSIELLIYLISKIETNFCVGNKRLETWKTQKISGNPGYDVPRPSVHRLFNEEQDVQRFGASLDFRASVVDCEIKNPMTLRSYEKNYLSFFSPSYYFQVQWTMAVRQRENMLFFVTCFDELSGRLLAYSLWFITFDRDLIERAILNGRVITDAIARKDPNFDIEQHTLVKEEDRETFATSREYIQRFCKHSTRMLTWSQ